MLPKIYAKKLHICISSHISTLAVFQIVIFSLIAPKVFNLRLIRVAPLCVFAMPNLRIPKYVDILWPNWTSKFKIWF